ncbi:hypothetical protein E2C01_085492 [Portunus trituberculatus]|uniref:Uncharacterized protein n=1 Tax=Portunus trituberculatus TaxID=210409 RepID=A0A5B7J7S0_PORTR|nr:hypothetical protein [Portunus trituberculatus]
MTHSVSRLFPARWEDYIPFILILVSGVIICCLEVGQRIQRHLEHPFVSAPPPAELPHTSSYLLSAHLYHIEQLHFEETVSIIWSL